MTYIDYLIVNLEMLFLVYTICASFFRDLSLIFVCVHTQSEHALHNAVNDFRGFCCFNTVCVINEDLKEKLKIIRGTLLS